METKLSFVEQSGTGGDSIHLRPQIGNQLKNGLSTTPFLIRPRYTQSHKGDLILEKAIRRNPYPSLQ